jgi:Right handed beta helix region
MISATARAIKGGGRSLGVTRGRRRVLPATELLESRDCRSVLAPSPAFEDDLARPRDAHLQARKASPKVKGLLAIYVAPGGRNKPTSGTKKHPLGNIDLAIKRAKPGATIYLAPGVYSQSIAILKHPNLTIDGAANGTSIIAPSSGDAIDVNNSTGITLNNLWLRSERSGGRGLAILGSAVTASGIKTDLTNLDGVVVAGYLGNTGSLVATASHFDSVQTGVGLFLEQGSTASISGCTFNNDGVALNAPALSAGLVLTGNAQASIVSSQFDNDPYGGLVGTQTSQVTAQQSTFSGSTRGDGALFFDQTTVHLQNNTFSSNGVTPGPTTGLNGVELNDDFTGTALINGNNFLNNTGDGLYIGSAPQIVQIDNNVFENNFTGLALNATGGPINVTVQGDIFLVTAGAAADDLGLWALGSGVTATIGGAGNLADTFSNFNNYYFIFPADTGDFPVQDLGYPNLILDGESFVRNGAPVPQSLAIAPTTA